MSKAVIEELYEHRRAEDEIAAQAAKIAVRDVFAKLGVNVDNPESVAEFQADLRFSRSLRRKADHGLLAIVAVAATALAIAAWNGIELAINNIKG